MKKLLLVPAVFALQCCNAQADAIGIYISGQVWDNQASGKFGEMDQQLDFNLADEKQGSYSIAFEHPLPFIPNAKIANTSLATQGITSINGEFSFDDKLFVDSPLSANFDVSYTDYTLYYEIFDNGLFSFDIGLTGRDFDGDVSVTGEAIDDLTITGSIATDDMVPMLYASTSLGLPLTGVNLFAQGNFLSVDEHSLYDYQAGVSYEVIDNLVVDFNLTLGYRATKFTLEDINDLYTDLEFKGLFAGAVVHF
ncbi:TIGR04219 family outer membrane beta-barrel protein [Thalassotalea sp. G2M2-11]|uniref:TIGR04219 family outer membrane beta-barrel protein n=1 Tax=Thalassotalea sp. G2M2-11 TaxID=2787627 RepID=UPI0019D12D1C|nr:TIGR04219 family outer membrane beta-barrel protein [Thalassotalea sp. G2M2-11]